MIAVTTLATKGNAQIREETSYNILRRFGQERP
jgi:hypothetical protein